AYQAAIRLRPDWSLPHLNLGVVLMAQGRRDDAVAAFKEATRLEPGLAMAHLKLGHGLLGRGRPVEALAAFREAGRLAPDLAEGQNAWAWLLATCPVPGVRDPRRALESATRAVELAPKDGQAWNTLGVARYRSGDWGGAREALETSMGLLAGRSEGFNTFFLA